MTNLIQAEETGELPAVPSPLESWNDLSSSERANLFTTLPLSTAENLFHSLDGLARANLLLELPVEARRIWLRQLPPDDVADVIQAAPIERREELFLILEKLTASEVIALLAYAEDDAGGLMNPRYARIRPDMMVDEAISYLKKQTRTQIEDVYYLYVLDSDQTLLGVVSFRDLFAANPKATVRDIMIKDPVRVLDTMDQEAVSKVLSDYNLLAVPVVSEDGKMKGIVTVHDIVDVVREEATEDIHKMGATEVLDAPYLDTTLPRMVQKRAYWLSGLFVGEMLTATAMGYFQDEISKAVVLALFIPLIISSGGNSGSQASTLVIRSLALGELRLRDWWRVLRREIICGVGLGAILGSIGVLRILLWPTKLTLYGEHYLLVAATVGTSLVGVVTYGCIVGGVLPLALRKLGLDPASASAPFVATLVDVTGLVIYFTIARIILGGVLL
ncbi:MAG: magnesium transporter [Proteobacteria bacterium]|nr:magnesium transporter [Pseudomonadota bacterium]